MYWPPTLFFTGSQNLASSRDARIIDFYSCRFLFEYEISPIYDNPERHESKESFINFINKKFCEYSKIFIYWFCIEECSLCLNSFVHSTSTFQYKRDRERWYNISLGKKPTCKVKIDFMHSKNRIVFLRIKRETDLQMYKCIRKMYCVRALPLRIFKRSSPSNPTTLPNAELKKNERKKEKYQEEKYLCSRDEMMIGMIYWLHS